MYEIDEPKDFLESAALLIPALTGLSVTIYDHDMAVLDQFESRYCFSPRLQRIYTAQGLQGYLANASEDFIYDILETLGSRLVLFKAGSRWVMLGPYVEEAWSDHQARLVLAQAEASEAAVSSYKAYRCRLPICKNSESVRMAYLIIEHSKGKRQRQIKEVCLDEKNMQNALTFNEAYADASVVNRRYALEAQIITAVSCGDSSKVQRLFQEMAVVTSDIKFISNDMRDQLVSAAIIRTIVRIGAKQAGLSPVLIDSISQEYAQRMRHAASKTEISRLIMRMIEKICAQIQAKQKAAYSLWVARAIEYMSANLSKPMTIQEISLAAGMGRHELVRRFGQETGMTVKQYLAKKRCEIAAELLCASKASVQEIAAYVGYADNNYFSKVFKANYGMTPWDYRRSRMVAD